MAVVCHVQITRKNGSFPWEESDSDVATGLIPIFKEISQSFLGHQWGRLAVGVWLDLARLEKHVCIPVSECA